MKMVGRIVGVAAFFLITTCEGFNIYNNACEDYSDYRTRGWKGRCYYNPNVLSDTATIIIRNGYSLETYTVTTRDGYVLTIFRIPPRHQSEKKPIFLLHGIFLDSSTWVYVGNRSLAFNLADRSYDVWLGTIRGTNFSKSHRRYNISRKEYWNFNLDSLAYFDVGTQLKFIGIKTKKSITYIGYSMGAALIFLYAAGYPAEAENVLSRIIALAPALYLEDVVLMDDFKEIVVPLERQLNKFQIYGLFYQSNFQKTTMSLCGQFPYVCKRLLRIFAGPLSEQFLPDELLVFFSHCPSGTGVQVLKHYLQIWERDYLTRYDYGTWKNLKYYRSKIPGRYDLGYLNLPVFLFYGRNDGLATEKSVKRLFRELGSRKKRLVHVSARNGTVPFNHIDFLMGKDVVECLHNYLFTVLEEN